MKNLYASAARRIQKKHGRIYYGNPSLWSTLPQDGGVYLIFDRRKPLALYCGKAKNLRQRLFQNLLQGQDRSHTLRTKLKNAYGVKNTVAFKQLLRNHFYIRLVIENDPKERAYLEHYMIGNLRCPFND